MKDPVATRIQSRAREQGARFRASYPRTLTTAVEPNQVNADQFCRMYEYVDPADPTSNWRGTRTETLEHCVADRAPEFVECLDVTDVNEVTGRITLFILELGRRRRETIPPDPEGPCELCDAPQAPWTGHGHLCQPCRDRVVAKFRRR